MQEQPNYYEPLLTEALRLGATSADALWYHSAELRLSCRQALLEGVERSESQALGLRVLVGKRQAIVSTTEFSNEALKALAGNAVAMAKASPDDEFLGIADANQLPTHAPDLSLFDETMPNVEKLFEMAKEAEDVARATKGITNSEGADAGYSHSHIGLAIASQGTLQWKGKYSTSHFSLSACVLAGEGEGMQRDYASSSKRYLRELKTPSAIGHEAASRTLKKMHPRKIKSGKVSVLFDRRVSKQLLSSFAACISGNAIVRGSSFLKDAMHTRVFSDTITIIDDPLRQRGLGSRPFDGEGVAAAPLALVDAGVLNHWLLDIRSANALGLSTNGRAYRGLSSPPSPSATNLTMQAGQHTPEALMKDAGTGLLITETFGMGINHVTGDYSQGASGFWFENGEIAYPVSEITIAGKLQDMFLSLTPANDLVFDYATNAPSCLVAEMTVAGL